MFLLKTHKLAWNSSCKSILPFARRTIIIAIVFTCLLSFPSPNLADTLEHEKVANLISSRQNQPIPIAIRPAPNQPITGYGVNGNKIIVIEQVGDYMDFDDPNATWCHIRLKEKPYTEGWIQGKFVSMDKNIQ